MAGLYEFVLHVRCAVVMMLLFIFVFASRKHLCPQETSLHRRKPFPLFVIR